MQALTLPHPILICQDKAQGQLDQQLSTRNSPVIRLPTALKADKMPGMDHKAFVTALPADQKSQLTELSNRAGLLHLAGHLGLIAALGAGIALGVPGWPILLLPQGVALIFLFTLEHECTHRTPFATPLLNDWVGRACGFLLFLPFEWFRYFHLAHHRWTNIAGQDPELDGAKPDTPRQWITHVSGLPYWWSEGKLILSLTMGRGNAPYLPTNALPRIRTEARVMLMGYTLVLASLFLTPILFWVWLLPAVLGQPFLRLYLLAEHGDCPQVANMFENTRTTFTTKLVRFLAWNMPFHVEHHVYPAVPFYRLPDLHLKMQDHLDVTAQGYSAFTKSYLSRRMNKRG